MLIIPTYTPHTRHDLHPLHPRLIDARHLAGRVPASPTTPALPATQLKMCRLSRFLSLPARSTRLVTKPCSLCMIRSGLAVYSYLFGPRLLEGGGRAEAVCVIDQMDSSVHRAAGDIVHFVGSRTKTRSLCTATISPVLHVRAAKDPVN